MAEPSEQVRRYLEFGMALSQAAQQRVEALLQDLTPDDVQARVSDFVDRGRDSSEAIRASVLKELERQRGMFGWVTHADLAKLEARLDALEAKLATPAPAAAAPVAEEQAPAEGSPDVPPAPAAAAPKAAARKATAPRKAAPRKAVAPKAAAAKAPARKATRKAPPA